MVHQLHSLRTEVSLKRNYTILSSNFSSIATRYFFSSSKNDFKLFISYIKKSSQYLFNILKPFHKFDCIIYTVETPVGVEHMIVLLTPQCIQILLTPRMFPVQDFVVGTLARIAVLNMGWVHSILSCLYLFSK